MNREDIMTYKEIIEREHTGIYNIEAALKYGADEIKDMIWLRVSSGQPVPGCLSLACLRDALRRYGKEPFGYHNT
jgi:hypothetical protein